MKSLFVYLTIIFGCILGLKLAYASSVSVIDANNVYVTNDGNTTVAYSLNSINSQVIQSNRSYIQDQQKLLSDQEIYITWAQVQQMALAAEKSNQVNP